MMGELFTQLLTFFERCHHVLRTRLCESGTLYTGHMQKEIIMQEHIEAVFVLVLAVAFAFPILISILSYV